MKDRRIVEEVGYLNLDIEIQTLNHDFLAKSVIPPKERDVMRQTKFGA